MAKQASQPVMTPEQFKAWRVAVGARNLETAAKLLGRSIDAVRNYNSGRSSVDETTALACAAIYHKITYRDAPWMD